MVMVMVMLMVMLMLFVADYNADNDADSNNYTSTSVNSSINTFSDFELNADKDANENASKDSNVETYCCENNFDDSKQNPLWILIKILINADEDDDAIMTCICTCQMMELFLQYIFNDLVFKQASEDSLLFICTALFLW